MKKLTLIVRSVQTGGIENHVYDILKNASRFGYTPVLISLANVPIADKFLKLGIEIITLHDHMWMSSRSFLNIHPLYKVLKRIKPDLIHLHGARPIFIGSVAARLAGIKKIIATLHGSYKLMAFDKQKGKIDLKLRLVSKVIHAVGFFLSKLIVLDAAALMNEVMEVCHRLPISKTHIRKKCRTIHIGIDLKKISTNYMKDEVKTKIGIAPEDKIIGTIGRLDEPLKGIAVLLKAFSLLVAEKKNIRLLIVGEGDSKQSLMQLAESLNISNLVHFLGFWDDLGEIYTILDIFVLPSLSEGFPIVNLEAMAYGLPVISTQVGGAAEAVADQTTGLIIPSNDAWALAKAISDLLADDTKCAKMGREGQRVVTRRFMEEDMIKKIYTLYDHVANA